MALSVLFGVNVDPTWEDPGQLLRGSGCRVARL
jgi:hypothetical protein